MGAIQNRQGSDVGREGTTLTQSRGRLIGIDAARGLALVGLMAIHVLPSEIEGTDDPTLTWNLFSGHSAALFALLAGVGLALSSGGQRPHPGRRMAGNRLGLAVRAGLIGIIALVVAAFMPQNDPPAYGILLYYSVFFLLAIPFLHLRPRTLFFSAALFGIASPILLQRVGPALPEWSSFNPTLGHIFSEPAAVASQLLLTGSYPALAYMCYILAGLGIGRLDLRKNSILVWIAGTGAALAILANAASSILLYAADGYERLLATSGTTRASLDHAIVWGLGAIPDTSGWWLAIATPHMNTPLSIAQSLGLGLMVTALLILAGRKSGRWLTPLAAMGAMTLTLYSTHLLALSAEVHYEEQVVWFFVHLTVAVVFGLVWSRRLGQGPLERPVSAAARNFRQIVDDGSAGGSAGASGTATR
ncbi:heparan-alpha-glucosaminide N-acetyltransferase domain-containing protein [Arthrobacter pigmenti]